MMTPQEYMEVEKAGNATINAIKERIARAREEAYDYPPPVSRRPATHEDIVEGAIIWHSDYGGEFWSAVCVVNEPGDGSYIGYDGRSYSLDGAYVEDT